MRRIAAISLAGGLNLSDNVHAISSGECVQLNNYEVNTVGRYQRCLGYERFDGQSKPSESDPRLLGGYPFPSDESERLAIASEASRRRGLITSVPGSGKVLGVFVLKGIAYAFRNNESGTEALLYASSSSGWQIVATPTLLPGGKFNTVNTNFIGSADSVETVGCDGINKAFRFNGTTFTQIDGPITPDAPILVEALPSQVLVMAYRGGSFVFSGVGEPTKFSPVDGGGEIAVADEITALTMQANNSLMIGCRNRTYILYGTSIADFNLTTHTTTTGVHANTAVTIGTTYFVDDRGITEISRVQNFGNFDSGVVSQKIEPLINRLKGDVVCSFPIKAKNQYRLFFKDNTGIIMTMVNTGAPQFSTFSFNHDMTCVCSAEDEKGNELVLFGSSNGFVYQAEAGNSYDGEAYTDLLRTSFFDVGIPEHRKRWMKAVVEMSIKGEAGVILSADYDYSDPDIAATLAKDTHVIGDGGYWGQGVWDELSWSAASVYSTDFYLDGVGRNVSLTITCTSDISAPQTVNSILYHYSQRSVRR